MMEEEYEAYHSLLEGQQKVARIACATTIVGHTSTFVGPSTLEEAKKSIDLHRKGLEDVDVTTMVSG